jgi:cardiolipin synthase A/B
MSSNLLSSTSQRGRRGGRSAMMERLRTSIRRALGTSPRRRRSRAQKTALARAGRDPVIVWQVLADMLLRFGGASSGNDVRLYCEGDEAFEDVWQAIGRARQRVWYETYTLEPDRVGTRTVQALADAARRGCEVRLLYDALGSPRVTDAFLAPLRQAGGEIDRFNPILSWRRRSNLLTRDHRKIIILDNHTAFAGGMNTSEDYAGPRHGNGRFRDCHMRLRGPCVRDLANVTLGSLNLVRDAPRRDPAPRAGRRGGTFVQVLSSFGWRGRRAIQRSIRLTVRHAVSHCLISTPYFLPPRRLMKAMTSAARRGVDVRVLTAGVSDVPMIRAASQHIYGQFLHKGVRIFEMFGTTLHAKTMTIDGLYGTVGSFNLDQWSDKRNLEVNVTMIDAQIARELEAQFEDNLKHAREVTLHTWRRRTRWQRAAHWTAYQLMRL